MRHRARGDRVGVRRDAVALVRGHVGPALVAGIDPLSPKADPVVVAAMSQYAQLCGRPDDAGLRRRLLVRLESANDPRRELYLQLLSVINGWPAAESLADVFGWFIPALRARMPA